MRSTMLAPTMLRSAVRRCTVPLLRASALAGCLSLGGCGVFFPGLFSGAAVGPPFRDPGLSIQAASERIMVGRDTRTEVEAALGPGTVVHFDSGYELWAYRGSASPGAAAATEFIVLFAPSGVVHRTRIRPAYATQGPR